MSQLIDKSGLNLCVYTDMPASVLKKRLYESLIVVRALRIVLLSKLPRGNDMYGSDAKKTNSVKELEKENMTIMNVLLKKRQEKTEAVRRSWMR